MNLKNLNLILHSITSLGHYSAAAIVSLSRWRYVAGLTNLLVGSLTCCAFGVIALMLWFWKPDDSEYGDSVMFRIAAIIGCITIILVLLGTVIQPGLRDMLEPRGAAIAWILAHGHG